MDIAKHQPSIDMLRTVRAGTVHPSPEASRPTRSSALSYSTVGSGGYRSHIRYHTLHTSTLIRTKWFTSHREPFLSFLPSFRRCCLLLGSASGSEAAVLRHSSVHSLSSSLTFILSLFHPFIISFHYFILSRHPLLLALTGMRSLLIIITVSWYFYFLFHPFSLAFFLSF